MDLGPPGLQDSKCVLFKATKCVEIFYSSNRKFIQSKKYAENENVFKIKLFTINTYSLLLSKPFKLLYNTLKENN